MCTDTQYTCPLNALCVHKSLLKSANLQNTLLPYMKENAFWEFWVQNLLIHKENLLEIQAVTTVGQKKGNKSPNRKRILKSKNLFMSSCTLFWDVILG